MHKKCKLTPCIEDACPNSSDCSFHWRNLRGFNEETGEYEGPEAAPEMIETDEPLPFEEGNAEDPDWPVNIIAQQRYVYRGDRLTDDPLKGMICTAVRQPNGKCITGKTGSMLVEDEQGNRHVVLRRQLRKIKETPVTQAAGQEMQEAS